MRRPTSRLFATLDGIVRLEASRMRNDVPEALEKAGFQVEKRDPLSFYAVDAAVAATFALGVCEPAAFGLGGQTMMLLNLAGEKNRTFALDGSSRAPDRSIRDQLTKKDLRRGYRATTLPSTPATLAWALEQYGTVPLARALEPAIHLAEEGYRISILQYALTRRELRHLKRQSGAQFFLRDGVNPYPVGSLFQQPVLASTLRRRTRGECGDIVAPVR